MNIEEINKEVFKCIKNVTLIDIQNNKVMFFECKDTLVQTEVNTYEEYYEKLKKAIHPDYLNKYFDAISLSKLNELDQKTNSIQYVKLSSALSYANYFDVIRATDDDKVLILTLRANKDDKDNNGSDNILPYEIADLIVNMESLIENNRTDSIEVNNIFKYIKNMLNDLKNKNKSVLNYYQEKVILEVSKTYESLLIVDDDSLTRSIFKKVFEKEYNIIEAKNGEEAVEIIEKNIVSIKKDANPENIVGIFLDLKMPIMDGFGVLDYLTDRRIINRLPVIIISADDAKDTKTKVYGYDIADMVEKPFNYELIRKRVNNMVSMYAKTNILNNLIRCQDVELKNLLKEYCNSYLIDYKNINDNIEKVYGILLHKLADNPEFKIDTNLLIKTVKYYDIALKLVPRKHLENINNITIEEKNKLLNYPLMSDDILKYYLEEDSNTFLKYAIKIALMHNERYDGLGFPNKIKNIDIPDYIYLANISIELCNYIEIHGKEQIDVGINIINSKSNTKYSEDTIKIFNSVIEEIKKVWQ